MKFFPIRNLLLVFSAALLLASCQKEAGFTDDLDPSGNTGEPEEGGGPVTTDIKGDWVFIGSNAKVSTGISVMQGGQELRTEGFTDYDTEDNTGTLKITESQFILSGISYSVTDEMTGRIYLNNVLVSESSQPMEEMTPSWDFTYDYARENNDSVTFTEIGSMMPDISGNLLSPPSGPLGARVSVANNMLTIRIKYAARETQSQGGTPATISVNLENVMRFRRP